MSSSTTRRPQRRKLRINNYRDYQEAATPIRGPRFDRSEYRADLLKERSVIRGVNVEQYLDREG